MSVWGHGHYTVELGLNGGDLDVASLPDHGDDPGDQCVETARLEAPGQEMVRKQEPRLGEVGLIPAQLPPPGRHA